MGRTFFKTYAMKHSFIDKEFVEILYQIPEIKS